MEKVTELNTDLPQTKPEIGSYEAMKPWFDKVDALCQAFEDEFQRIKDESERNNR